jgi:two-component system sensor histidine kinase KdpD
MPYAGGMNDSISAALAFGFVAVSALQDAVSHELKTPLAVLQSAAEGLTQADEATRQQLTGEILTATRRHYRLVNNLLDQTRLESGALKPRLDNAALHTPAGTPIFLAAGVDGARSKVFFTVADRGPGLPAAMHDRLFRKFQRGDAARAGGLGLGLSIIRGFVVAQGGDVVRVRIRAAAPCSPSTCRTGRMPPFPPNDRTRHHA